MSNAAPGRFLPPCGLTWREARRNSCAKLTYQMQARPFSGPETGGRLQPLKIGSWGVRHRRDFVHLP